MHYARTITIDLGYEQAVEKVKEAFQAQGFGTLTEIDVRATLKEKLGQDMEPYVILGACNPQLAHPAGPGRRARARRAAAHRRRGRPAHPGRARLAHQSVSSRQTVAASSRRRPLLPGT